ncbi:Arm DNA-binding domain-containing protein [Delftia sp.]|uniref:Arm DNA-binding domain-containing protein n=1 Tax=Delftia sp. TaxID=1886637 RepID=UPI00259CDE3E|nr:Arm DNA-binding domain-containing protein [Delftia sp.]
MPKKSNLLNDLQIRRWIAASTPVSKSDGDGLTFTLSASGTATWVLRYRLAGGRRREVTIGNYPDIGLAGAREKARALRAQIDAGIDSCSKSRKRKADTRTIGP